MELPQQLNKKCWSVRSKTSIVVSRLLIMLKSFLSKSFQLHNRIFHEQFRSWHCGGKGAFRGCCLCFMMFLLIFIEHILLQSPWDTGILLAVELEWWLFCVTDPEMKKSSGMDFSTAKSERAGKKMCLIPYTNLPCSPISVLLHPDEWWGFLWSKHIDLPPPQLLLFPNWPKVLCAATEEFMNSWVSPLSPGAKPLRCCWVRGHPEGKAVRNFAVKTGSDWSLLRSQTCWADKGILLPGNWWNFAKYAKMKYPPFFFFLIPNQSHTSKFVKEMNT